MYIDGGFYDVCVPPDRTSDVLRLNIFLGERGGMDGMEGNLVNPLAASNDDRTLLANSFFPSFLDMFQFSILVIVVFFFVRDFYTFPLSNYIFD